jgi:hypothetical protein
MIPSSGRALWRIAVVVFVIALAATLWAVAGGPLIDNRPGAGAVATAERSEIAAIAPTIAAIEHIRQTRGTYPASLDDLAGHLPSGVMADTTGDTLTIDTGGGAVWAYQSRPDGLGYELSRHLPDGKSLVATADHGTITWSDLDDDDSKTEPAMLPSSG